MNHSLLFGKALAWLVFAIGFLPLAHATTVPNTSGHIVTRGGVTINFTGVQDISKILHFSHGPERTPTTAPLSRLARIRFGEGAQSARIELKDGRTLDANPGYYHNNRAYWSRSVTYFQYNVLDQISGQNISRRTPWRDIAEIVFDEAVGRFRVCPKCKAVWPDTYLFCPRDGTATEWGPTPEI